MSDSKKIAIALVLILLAAGSWWLTHRVAPPEPKSDHKLRHDPDYIVKNFTAYVMDEDGKRRYHLSANRLLHYPDDETAHLDQPYLIQYKKDGPPIHTRAEKGWLPDDASRILMTGSVHVTRGNDGRTGGGEIITDSMLIELDR